MCKIAHAWPFFISSSIIRIIQHHAVPQPLRSLALILKRLRELRPVQLRVNAAGIHQLLVLAALHDLAVLDDQNLIRRQDRRQAVSNQDARARTPESCSPK